MNKKRVLICDDEPNICRVLTQSLVDAGFKATSVHTLKEARAALDRSEADILFLDIFLPDGNGLDSLSEMRETHPDVPIIVLTAHGTMRTAVEAMKRRAFDYITKPFDILKAQELARRAAESIEDSPAPPSPPKMNGENEIIGNSAAMQEVYKTIGRIAESDVTALLLGECGTGKELVAQAIHANSRRAQMPYVAVNCAAIPDNLLESELFGHVRGAFTDAHFDREGRFASAENGTILLDEIGDIPLDLQTKLLRVLQERTYQRVGSDETLETNARVIAATNRDLDRAVQEGDFREDLLYRLNVVSITLPPLRRRREDIPKLAKYFLAKYCIKYGYEIKTASPALTRRLNAYHWPGNVRELENVIHRGIVMSQGRVLSEEDAPLLNPAAEMESGESMELWVRKLVQKRMNEGRTGNLHEEAVAGVERPLFQFVLDKMDGNKSRAAEALGINRNTLHAKLKKYELAEFDQEGADEIETARS